MILITRPKEQAKLIANHLQNIGYETLIQPLFLVKIRMSAVHNLEQYGQLQALIISSANAVNCLAQSDIARDILILAIGEKTAEQIKRAGFSKVLKANNSAASLLSLAQNTLNVKGGKVVYLSGNIVTVDIAAKLADQGFNSHRLVAYQTIERKTFTKKIVTKITDHSIKQILIYSKNTAMILHKLVLQHNLLEYFREIKLLCLSTDIASHCQELGFTRVGLINEILKKHD